MNKKHPHTPFALRLLRWFCPSHLLEEIEGDLMQKFSRDLKTSNNVKSSANPIRVATRRAHRRLLWNVIRFFRPGILLRNRFSFELGQLYLIRTYFVLASRSMTRNKVFSLVNLTGLSVSMVACMLIFQYVQFEFSYDRFHANASNIYRVATKVTLQDEVIVHETNTYDGIHKALNTTFPEVKATTSIRKFNADKNFIRYENQHKEMVPLPAFKAFDVDSTFFDVFSFQLAAGNPDVVLQDSYSTVISETFAAQCFSGNAIGKFLEIYDGDETHRYTITGVLKNVPANSHIKFDLLTRSGPKTKNFWNGDVGFWDWGGQSYVLLQDQANPVLLESKLGSLALSKNGLKNNKDDYGQVSTFELQPLLDIHLYSHLDEELEINGNSALVYALIAFAIMILVIAWINYVNLSTAISEEKIKSVGVRKVIGASRRGLMLQVLSESALFNAVAVMVAISLIHLLLPAFTNFAGIPLNYKTLYAPSILAAVFTFMMISTILSGLYPAFVVSSFFPIRALKGKLDTGNGFSLRKVLVVFQFSAALILLITTIVAYQQLSFMRNKDLGININQVMIVKALNFDKEKWSNDDGGFIIDSTYLNKVDLFKEEIRSQTGFLNATSLSHIPGQLPNWGTEFKAESIDPEKAYRLTALGIDYDFLSTLQVKLLAGRNFSPAFPSDRGNEGKRAILLNEAACKLLGFRTPEEAIHKHISTYWKADYEIIGVVNSFHQLSLKENLQPIYFILQPRALDYFAIHYRADAASDAIEQARSTWNRFFPDVPFNFFFLDEYFDQQYQYDRKFRDIMILFSGLAIVIACLGLFGLTTYAIVKRTKEIGIRKVLGATVTQIIRLFTLDFVKLILVANVVALPLVYFGLDRWLENYAYQIPLGWWLFAIPALFILVIGLTTIGFQTIKVASKNPVSSLRNE